MEKDRKKQIQEEEYIKPYHWMLDKNLERLYSLRNNLVLELLGDLSNKKVLDFGCGDGKFTSALAQHSKGEKYIAGVDVSSRAIRFARCLVPEAEFFELKSRELNFSNSFFDIVCCLDVLEHIPPSEIDIWMGEIYRVTKENGKLVFSVPSKLKNLDEKHFQHFTTKKLEELFSEHFTGFQFQGYFYKLPVIPVEIVDKIYNKGTIWKIFTPLVKKCPLKKALYIAGICYKK